MQLAVGPENLVWRARSHRIAPPPRHSRTEHCPTPLSSLRRWLAHKRKGLEQKGLGTPRPRSPDRDDGMRGSAPRRQAAAHSL